MKSFLFLLLFMPFFCVGQYTVIPDENFDKALIRLGCDDNLWPDGKVLTNKIDKLKSMNLFNQFISDLTGIKSFTDLTELNCKNNQLKNLDLSNNTVLEKLDCSGNQLSSLDISGCSSLKSLDCSGNQLSSLDISGCTSLSYLSCEGNNFNCNALKLKLEIDYSQIMEGFFVYNSNQNLKKVNSVIFESGGLYYKGDFNYNTGSKLKYQISNIFSFNAEKKLWEKSNTSIISIPSNLIIGYKL